MCWTLIQIILLVFCNQTVMWTLLPINAFWNSQFPTLLFSILSKICFLTFTVVKPLPLRLNKLGVSTVLTGTYQILISLRPSLVPLTFLSRMNRQLVEALLPCHPCTILSWYKIFGVGMVFLKYILTQYPPLNYQVIFDTLS